VLVVASVQGERSRSFATARLKKPGAAMRTLCIAAAGAGET
jgi:hypothetical protein